MDEGDHIRLRPRDVGFPAQPSLGEVNAGSWIQSPWDPKSKIKTCQYFMSAEEFKGYATCNKTIQFRTLYLGTNDCNKFLVST